MNRNVYIFLLIGLFLASCSQKVRIVLLPDTQTYAEKYPEIMDTQLNWIAHNAKHINFVLQQGDLTQNNNDKEWQTVKNAFSKIDNKVPYILAVGNHDMGSGPGKFADVSKRAERAVAALTALKERRFISTGFPISSVLEFC